MIYTVGLVSRVCDVRETAPVKVVRRKHFSGNNWKDEGRRDLFIYSKNFCAYVRTCRIWMTFTFNRLYRMTIVTSSSTRSLFFQPPRASRRNAFDCFGISVDNNSDTLINTYIEKKTMFLIIGPDKVGGSWRSWVQTTMRGCGAKSKWYRVANIFNFGIPPYFTPYSTRLKKRSTKLIFLSTHCQTC